MNTAQQGQQDPSGDNGSMNVEGSQQQQQQQQSSPLQGQSQLGERDPSTLLHPLAILIDELKSEDVVLRLNAIRRLSTIALALGPERTREELVPFLLESLDDEDEVLLALAEELGNFVEYLGGQPHAHLLLGPLENLAAVEETLVRDKAAESINKVCQILSPAQIVEVYLPLLRRLSTGEWFTSRSSATALYASAYPRITSDAASTSSSSDPSSSSSADLSPATVTGLREEMVKMFATLCTDDTPMVRRSAAKEMGAFTKQLDKQTLIKELVPVFRKLSSDDQDSVRLLTVDSLIAIADAMDTNECKTYLGPTMKSMVSDKSWRVRYMVADNFVKLAEAAGEDIVREELVSAFVHLLKDQEAEVRTAAAGQIPGFAKLVTQDIILARLMPCVRDLSTDTSQHVRAALGAQISGLAPLLGKQPTIDNLLPLFLQLLKDEFPEVRLNIISKLEQVNSVIGIELLSQALLPAIMQLAEDKQWRVRQAIIEYIPLLANQLGVAFFDEKLGNLCMGWLADPVFSIREAATVNLRKLTEVFGVEWAAQTLLPKVVANAGNANYLYRLTTVFAITTMAPALNAEITQAPTAPASGTSSQQPSILETVNVLASDPIPNIRFNVAKALEVLATVLADKPGGNDLVRDTVIPALMKLKDDDDADVRYFAGKALEIAHPIAKGQPIPMRSSGDADQEMMDA